MLLYPISIVLNSKIVIPAKKDAAPTLSGVGVCENNCDNVNGILLLIFEQVKFNHQSTNQKKCSECRVNEGWVDSLKL